MNMLKYNDIYKLLDLLLFFAPLFKRKDGVNEINTMIVVEPTTYILHTDCYRTEMRKQILNDRHFILAIKYSMCIHGYTDVKLVTQFIFQIFNMLVIFY